MSELYGGRVAVRFGVLGPVTAWRATGELVPLRGPMHRAVLARLIVARGRVVPVGHLVDDLWVAPPDGAVSAVRTFVAALRRALEPDRRPRTPPALLVTESPGYALRLAPDAVDAWRFEQALTTPAALPEALSWWRGPAYADFPSAPWARAERARLAELRLHAVEVLAAARPPAEAVPDLEAHVTEHPWREEGWRLLALALYRTGRQGDALAVLRRAREQLIDRLGLDRGPALRELETSILRQDVSMTPTPIQAEPPASVHAGPPASVHAGPPASVHAGPPAWVRAEQTGSIQAEQTGSIQAEQTGSIQAEQAGSVWAEAAADYERTVGTRARLGSTVGLLRNLAVTGGGGGLEAAGRHRLATIAAAEELGDPALTARVIGAYDVPAIWTRSDDPERAALIVAAARRTLPSATGAARARLLATIAVESRGIPDREPAAEAVALARQLDDPALLAFALNALYMQTFHRCGLAPARDEIGAELIALSAQHNLPTYEVLGHLIRVQSRSAEADFAAADAHARAADRLAADHELPLVGVFTEWYRAMRQGTPDAYRVAAAHLTGAGMPGLEHGLLALALLCLGEPDHTLDYGSYRPWAQPHVLLAQGRTEEARDALRTVPDPPADLLAEALWCLTNRAAEALGQPETAARARAALLPAAGQIAAGSGVLSAGPVPTSRRARA
ncbi:AfsR/SARP family transcriptional regulator [Paractinoplanes hotanensis]|uniref:Winged helix-turn-helix domain-containing protein n=1 Tax=Paractinoplanes hotanensis TaxID=2906497 RepID=A0ABT0Y4U2_9ACTN|nr:BTAD domain-containing putative transcriptional regulator [Actinoplanes hotanensis]MCM4080329.1 winged helix-turn-helix domain-containing protein [Actinoplanes hotanensis]